MAYKIRYGPDKYIQHSRDRTIQLQILVSVGLLVLTAISRLWTVTAHWTEQVLSAEPLTLTEQAVYALSSELVRDAGWYQALAVWCRMIIYGAPV